MSLKIFLLQLSGKIKPISIIEKQRAQLYSDFIEFQKFEKSNELKDFLNLEKLVNSEEFKNKKKEIEGLSFKGSKEEAQLKEYNTLKKSKAIRQFFQVKDSQDLIRYVKECVSEKMGSYNDLLNYVKGGYLEKDKKKIKSQVFKGSEEEKSWNEFKKLDKSAAICAYKELDDSGKIEKHEKTGASDKLKKYNHFKNSSQLNKEEKSEFKILGNDSEIKDYIKFENSKKLKLFREIRNSNNLKRYNELKAYVESDDFKKKVAFLKDKKKFEKSEAYKKYDEYKRLAADNDVKFVQKYEKSSLYKNYQKVKDSTELRSYYELEKIIQSDEYEMRKAFLEDKKRWEKREEYKIYQQYLKEKDNPEIIKYFKYKDSSDFDFLKQWEVTFEDSFEGESLDDAKWSTLKTVSKAVGQNIAMPGDLGVFTTSGNVKTGNKLLIQVKKEKAKGVIWQSGLMPVDFRYTSGFVTTAEHFKFSDGIVEAKIKFNQVKQVASSFYLTDGSDMPRVNLLEMGTKNNFGISTLNGSKINTTGLDISNLKKGTYIFTLEKNKSSFTWKINETEVFKILKSNLNKSFELNASSLIVNEIAGSSADFEIEWVKCYRKK